MCANNLTRLRARSSSSPLIFPQNTNCSTHTYHSRRQKFCCRRTACVEQFTGYYKTRPVINSEHSNLDTARRTHQRLTNCATLRTMNYSAKPIYCRTIYCTHVNSLKQSLKHYHHCHELRHNAITSDTVRTPYSCLNIQHNYPTLIS